MSATSLERLSRRHSSRVRNGGVCRAGYQHRPLAAAQSSRSPALQARGVLSPRIPLALALAARRQEEGKPQAEAQGKGRRMR
ncbi:unnamed protein product [Closterium sp. NIES-65]|nr:unnamed protein product [Closterium sp. NIES-65]